MSQTTSVKPNRRWMPLSRQRRGATAVMGAMVLSVMFAFAAFAVDSGRMVMTQTNLQNTADAAALAAAQEITMAIHQAGEDDGEGTTSIDEDSPVVAAARAMAAAVASANGVHVDPDSDIEFGRRTYSYATDTWSIAWNDAPYNVVRVTARRDNPDTSEPDGELPLSFGWAVGRPSVPLTATATAFVESRDLVLVLDFSASMNDDSSMMSFGTLGQAAVEDSLDAMWDSLVASGTTWPSTSEPKFPASGFGGINSYYGTYLISSSPSIVFQQLGLHQLRADGTPVFPFPQSGRGSDGLPLPRPDYLKSRSLWFEYIIYVQTRTGAYNRRYGYRTLLDFLQDEKFLSRDSEDLWRTPHYPFHAIKEGASQFLDFLTDLDFGDEVGMVSYATTSRYEMLLNDGDAYVDISSDPVTPDLAAIDLIFRHKQAGHYSSSTAMGDGIKDATEMLVGIAGDPTNRGFKREGARPTMIIMTDGQTNVAPWGWRAPPGFSLSEWADYDGDGSADYDTWETPKLYAFWQATEAIRQGITIHTMSVGAAADADLMRAIAFAGRGVWMHVPGGTTVAEMESQLEDAWREIASKVPPPKLIHDGN
jgi:Flp pilus assembly protein TadG